MSISTTTSESTLPSLLSDPISPTSSGHEQEQEHEHEHEHEHEDDGIHSDWSPSSNGNENENETNEGSELDYDMLASQDWSERSEGEISSSSHFNSLSEKSSNKSDRGVGVIESLSGGSMDGKEEDEDEEGEGGEGSRMRLSFPDPLDTFNLDTPLGGQERILKRRSTITTSTQTDESDSNELEGGGGGGETEYSFLLEDSITRINPEETIDSVVTLPLITSLSRTSTPLPSSSSKKSSPATRKSTNKKSRKIVVDSSSSRELIPQGRDSLDVSKWVESSGSYSEAMKKSEELEELVAKSGEVEVGKNNESSKSVEKEEVKKDEEERLEEKKVESQVKSTQPSIQESKKKLTNFTTDFAQYFSILILALAIPLSFYATLSKFSQIKLDNLSSISTLNPTTTTSMNYIVELVTSTSTIVHFMTQVETVTATATTTRVETFTSIIEVYTSASAVPAELQEDSRLTSDSVVVLGLVDATSGRDDLIVFPRKDKASILQEEKLNSKRQKKFADSRKERKAAKKLKGKKNSGGNHSYSQSNSIEDQFRQEEQQEQQFLDRFSRLDLSNLISLFEKFSFESQLDILKNLSSSSSIIHSNQSWKNLNQLIKLALNSPKLHQARKSAKKVSKLFLKEFDSKIIELNNFFNSSSIFISKDRWLDEFTTLEENAKKMVKKLPEDLHKAQKVARKLSKQVGTQIDSLLTDPRTLEFKKNLTHRSALVGKELKAHLSKFTSLLNHRKKKVVHEAKKVLIHRVKNASKGYKRIRKGEVKQRWNARREREIQGKVKSKFFCGLNSNDRIARWGGSSGVGGMKST